MTKQRVDYPHNKARDGKPHTSFEDLGPFRLRATNQGFYDLYSITLDNGVLLLKQASKPCLYDACVRLNEALSEGTISLKEFDTYRTQAEVVFKQHPERLLGGQGKVLTR